MAGIRYSCLRGRRPFYKMLTPTNFWRVLFWELRPYAASAEHPSTDEAPNHNHPEINCNDFVASKAQPLVASFRASNLKRRIQGSNCRPPCQPRRVIQGLTIRIRQRPCDTSQRPYMAGSQTKSAIVETPGLPVRARRVEQTLNRGKHARPQDLALSNLGLAALD